MRALFASAMLAIGAFSDNSLEHGPWDILIPRVSSDKLGALLIITDWAKNGG